MVGHTGVYEAALKAVAAIDDALAQVEAAVLASGGRALITADHGNCEQMVDRETGQPHTQHTTELVPLVYVGEPPVTFRPGTGKLADIAPTLLTLMDLPQPAEMTGSSLIEAGS